jgi:NAD+ kinase
MATISLALHGARPEATDAARALVERLVPQGHRFVASARDVATMGSPTDVTLVEEGPGGLASVDLAVALGGDGTVLRTVEALRGAPVPVLGVNLGQLGYLTEVEVDDLDGAVDRFLAGSHAIEQRMLLEVLVASGDADPQRLLALNEATIDRTVSGHTIRLDVAIDGQAFTPYEVDALIVATPTGSTAYGYSAGGPIAAPTHSLLLLTPVSPHMLFDRTLVLEHDSTVGVVVGGHRPACLVVDGLHIADLGPGDSVTCTAASEHAQLVVFGPRNFPRLLKAKFKLSDR